MPAPFRLSPPERRELKRMSRSQGGRADEVRRARIILGLAGGQSLAAISRSQACSVNTVKLWRKRFLEGRISGLCGRHPGKAVAPGTERLEARIIDWTLHRKPADGSEFTQTCQRPRPQPHESGPCLDQGWSANLSGGVTTWPAMIRISSPRQPTLSVSTSSLQPTPRSFVSMRRGLASVAGPRRTPWI